MTIDLADSGVPHDAAERDSVAAEAAYPEREPTDLDDTGIGVVLPAKPSHPRGGGDRVRIGFVSMPSGPFSCALALAVHGVALAVALCAARFYFQPPQLPANWGGGGGRDITLASAGATDTMTTELPGDASVPAAPPTWRTDSPTRVADDVPPFPSARATQLNSEFDDRPDDTLRIIGAFGSANEADIPRFKTRQGPVAPVAARTAPRGTSSAPGGAIASASTPAVGNAGPTSHAGLPGALLGKGIPAPDYPIEARRRGEQGVVKVAVEVLPDGSMGEIRIVSEPGFPLLRQAALAATQRLRRFAFTPAYRFGRPTRDYVVIPYHFILQ